MANAARMSFTVPAPLADSMTRVARRLRISRSALLAQLLTEPMAQLEKLVDLVPDKPNEGDIRRFRGESVAAINRVVDEALEAANVIDPEQKLPL